MVFIPANTSEGQAIMSAAKMKAVELASAIASKGISVEIHEITAPYLSLTVPSMDVARMFTMASNSALVFCGFFNTSAASNSTTGRTLRLQKGNKFLTDLHIFPIGLFADDKRGVDSGFPAWGIWQEGEDISWGFRETEPTSVAQVWPIGYVVVPEGSRDVVQ